MIKKIVVLCVVICISTALYALDSAYTPIIKTTLSDLKKQSKLSTLRGHVTLSISSGSKELDAQFAEAIQKAYPHFSKEETVRGEDAYIMMVKVYRVDAAAAARVTVTDYKQQKIVDRTIALKKVPPALMETLQYETQALAKNTFDVYLDTAFGSAGAVVQDARLIPKPETPPKEPFTMPDWIKPTFDCDFKVGGGFGTGPQVNTFIAMFLGPYCYLDATIGEKKEKSISINSSSSYSGSGAFYNRNISYQAFHFSIGGILPYNEYLLFPIGVGYGGYSPEKSGDTDDEAVKEALGVNTWGFQFFESGWTANIGIMLKIKWVFLTARYRFGGSALFDSPFEFIAGFVH